MCLVFSIRISSLQSSNRCAHLHESDRNPTGRLFWGGAVPGTSCQATIAPSLRDISQQALARYCEVKNLPDPATITFVSRPTFHLNRSFGYFWIGQSISTLGSQVTDEHN